MNKSFLSSTRGIQVYSEFPWVERTVFFPRCERVDASGTPRTKNVNMITSICASSVFRMHRNDAAYCVHIARKVQRMQIEKYIALGGNSTISCGDENWNTIERNVNGEQEYKLYHCSNDWEKCDIKTRRNKKPIVLDYAINVCDIYLFLFYRVRCRKELRAMLWRDIRKNSAPRLGFPGRPLVRSVHDFETCNRRATSRFKATENLFRDSFLKLIKSLQQFRIVSLTKMQCLIRRADACKICYYTLRLSSMMWRQSARRCRHSVIFLQIDSKWYRGIARSNIAIARDLI